MFEERRAEWENVFYSSPTTRSQHEAFKQRMQALGQWDFTQPEVSEPTPLTQREEYEFAASILDSSS